MSNSLNERESSFLPDQLMTSPTGPLSTPHTAAPVVFISSTVRDFADLRGAIGYVLRQRGVSVLMSEAWDFPVLGDHSTFQECIENIRSSDLYVLIVDKTRGSLYTPNVSVPARS